VSTPLGLRARPATALGVARPPLAGRVALVTAGWTELAVAVAARFREEGAEVVSISPSEAVVDEIAVATGAVAFVGDPASPRDVAAAVTLARDRFGGLDALIVTTSDRPDAVVLSTGVGMASRELAERRGAVVVVSPFECCIAELTGECGRWGVRVNAVVPGSRCAAPRQVASAIRFLASPEAAVVTGCVLRADAEL